MKRTRFRLVLAGVLGLAAVLVPISVPFAENLFGGSASATSTLASPDVITYAQTSSGTSVTFTPGGGGAATTQTLTPVGLCGTPTVTPAATPILGMSGLLYPPDKDVPGQPDDNDYSGTPKTVPPGSFKQHTGVCGFPLYSQIENLPPFGEEGLDFTVLGSNSLIGNQRVFSDAKISLQNEAEWPWNGAEPVQLVEMLGGVQVGTVTCTLSGPEGTTVTVDTNGNSVCTGGTTPIRGFDTVEIELPKDDTAASVVGTSTFTLAPQVCGGGSVTTPSGSPVAATLDIAPGAGCESYTNFSSNGNTLTYDEYSGGTPQPFTVTINWAPVPECQPYGDDNHPDSTSTPIPASLTLPTCAPTEFSFDGTTYYDQTYCAGAQAPGAGVLPEQSLCTTNKSYNNLTPTGSPYVVPNGSGGTEDGTQITETWSGDSDWYMR